MWGMSLWSRIRAVQRSLWKEFCRCYESERMRGYLFLLRG
jgi:hypothetical protein